MFIELKLDKKLKKMISDKNILLNGFSTLQIVYSTLVFHFQSMHTSLVRPKSQDLKYLIEECLMLN